MDWDLWTLHILCFRRLPLLAILGHRVMGHDSHHCRQRHRNQCCPLNAKVTVWAPCKAGTKPFIFLSFMWQGQTFPSRLGFMRDEALKWGETSWSLRPWGLWPDWHQDPSNQEDGHWGDEWIVQLLSRKGRENQKMPANVRYAKLKIYMPFLILFIFLFHYF